MTYEEIGSQIGSLVDRKNEAYGDSFNQSHKILEVLYPDGIPVAKYREMLATIRVVDKLFRISSRPAGGSDAFVENPWNDIAGYGILASKELKDD